jgi:hypothetical protein
VDEQLTVAQRRRRVVDSAVWAVLLSVLVLQFLVPMVRAVSHTSGSVIVALFIYLPMFGAAIDISFRYFGFAIGGHDVIRPNVWAAVFIAFWVTLGVPGVGGILRLATLSIAYLLCEYGLPETRRVTA